MSILKQTVLEIAPQWKITIAFDEAARKVSFIVDSPFELAAEDCKIIRSSPSSFSSGATYASGNLVRDKSEMIQVEGSASIDGAMSRKRKFSASAGTDGSQQGEGSAAQLIRWDNIKKHKVDATEVEVAPLFMNLPIELQLHIFSFIPPLNLANEVQMVCSDWRRLAKDESLWHAVHRKLWDGPKAKDNTWQKDCLQIKREVQFRNDTHATKMLLWAAQRGYLGLIKNVIQNSNITVNTCNKKKVTALLVAAEVGHVSVVGYLLENNANVEAAASKSATSLYMAAQHGHTEVVQQLLKAGANVNAKTDYGTTALFVAAQMGNIALVKLLLASGADVNIPMNNLQTPLFVAVREGNIQIVQLLLNANADVNAQRSDGTTPLVMAAYKGYFEIVQLLVAAGARVNAAPQGGMSALFVASQQGATKIVRFLLEKTASDVNAATAGGTTPLLIATQKGHQDVVELLIRNGANLEAQLKDGTTAQMIAEGSGFREIASLLAREARSRRVEEPGGQRSVRMPVFY